MYYSLIINLLDSKISESKKICNSILNKYNDKLSTDATIWIFSKSYLDDKGDCIPSSLLVADSIKNLILRNMIVVPDFNNEDKLSFFNNHTFDILFFSKSKKYFFNIDPIREKHIWKDVEWGKRKKNYNILGKSPGNVWLKTEDDGAGNITKHIMLSVEDSLSRILKSTVPDNGSALIVNFSNINNILNLNDKIKVDSINA